jgi:hypothetical protein
LKKEGKFNRFDWLFTFGLLLIGYASLKRAVWFILPVVITLLAPRRSVTRRLALLGLVFIPLVFYVGIRLNPTLNPERKVWGDFDLQFALDYAEAYAFGEEDLFQEKAMGRGGATKLVLERLFTRRLSDQDIWGYGLRYMYGTSYLEFNEFEFGINHKGSATGIFQTMITNGYFGILTTLLFFLSIITLTKNTRIRWVLIIFFFWDYTLYSGLLIREPALSFMLAFISVMARPYTYSYRKLPGNLIPAYDY